jgi:hypothetical protein
MGFPCTWPDTCPLGIRGGVLLPESDLPITTPLKWSREDMWDVVDSPLMGGVCALWR